MHSWVGTCSLAIQPCWFMRSSQCASMSRLMSGAHLLITSCTTTPSHTLDYASTRSEVKHLPGAGGEGRLGMGACYQAWRCLSQGRSWALAGAGAGGGVGEGVSEWGQVTMHGYAKPGQKLGNQGRPKGLCMLPSRGCASAVRR